MNRTDRVLHDFGKRVEDYPWRSISDVACLPHPKEEIRDALFAAILAEEITNEEDSTRRNALQSLLTRCLPKYQKGVGDEPLYAMGFNCVGFLREPVESFDSFVHTWAAKTNSVNAERFKQMSVQADFESAGYFDLLATLSSNSSKKADYEEMANLLRSQHHSIDNVSKFLPAETCKLFIDDVDIEEDEEDELLSLDNEQAEQAVKALIYRRNVPLDPIHAQAEEIVEQYLFNHLDQLQKACTTDSLSLLASNELCEAMHISSWVFAKIQHNETLCCRILTVGSERE